METYAFYRKGLSVAQIARKRNCTTGTIETHLIDCARAGYAIEIAHEIPRGLKSVVSERA